MYAPALRPAPSLLSALSTSPAADRVAAALSARVWRASELGTAIAPVFPSGWPELDAQLPGGGWPCQSLTEILLPHTATCEWRLTGPALHAIAAEAGTVLLVGPPAPPHVPGLLHAGLNARQLVWIQAQTMAERLWATEQLIRANTAAAVLAWVPQALPEHIRRLQINALHCDALVCLFRPAEAGNQPSAAPLRVRAQPGSGWNLQVRILKRRGAPHEGVLHLPAIPGGLAGVLPPRLRKPRLALPSIEVSHAMGRTATRTGTLSLVH